MAVVFFFFFFFFFILCNHWLPAKESIILLSFFFSFFKYFLNFFKRLSLFKSHATLSVALFRLSSEKTIYLRYLRSESQLGLILSKYNKNKY